MTETQAADATAAPAHAPAAPLALVTGATGYVGSSLVPDLLEHGWRVRVLTRSPHRLPNSWTDRVEVSEGDLEDAGAVADALTDVQIAYYLAHSMDGKGDFVARDRRLAHIFADAARRAGVQRLVYLGGLHPREVELSPHLASRVEVGEILAASGVPTVVLQAGVVLGSGSASFRMLRHLTERLPLAFGPRWLNNQVQPIAIGDAVHYLRQAGQVALDEIPADDTAGAESTSRVVDIGMPESFTYAEMMRRYAQVLGLRRRFIGTVPVLTPGLASHWVGLVTPVPPGIARPLVGSLTHDAVVDNPGPATALGAPPGGLTGFSTAVRRSISRGHATAWSRIAARTAAAVAAVAVAGSILTTPQSDWYEGLDKPSWQPPPSAFPIVWSALFAGIWASSALTLADLDDAGLDADRDRYARALVVNLLLNAGWSGVFFRAHGLPAATAVAGLLAVSSADLARRASSVRGSRGVPLAAYAAWCAFATVLTGAIARANPDADR